MPEISPKAASIYIFQGCFRELRIPLDKTMPINQVQFPLSANELTASPQIR